MKQLKALSLKLTNVLGIDELEIDLSGKITVISGANGVGKTSCIEGLKSVLQSAESATLLKNGASHGKSVLVLNDGTQIISTLKPGKSSKRVMFGEDKKAFSQSPTQIAQLFDPHSLNPVEFLLTKGKIRIDLLLEAMPIEVNLDRFEEICGPRVNLSNNPDLDALGLIVESRKVLYDLRTGDNRIVNETQSTINTLQKSLDGAQPFDANRLTECNVTVAKIDGELKEQIVKAKQNYTAKKTTCDNAINTTVNKKVKLRQAYEKKCRELDSEIKEFERLNENNLTNIKQQIKNLTDQTALKRPAVNTEIELLEAAKKAFEGQEATRESIKGMQAKAEDHTVAARMLTESIIKIDNYKAELLANMPIKGLSIDGEQLMLDGVLFDRANMAKRVGVAMKLAKLRAGNLKMILVDGLLDIMDSKTREEFYTQANESGCQIVVTKVSDGKLMVTQPMTYQEQETEDLKAEIDELKAW